MTQLLEYAGDVKVKIIEGYITKTLEKTVNQWLSDHPDYFIVSTQFAKSASDQEWSDMVIIYYKEAPNETDFS